MNVKGGESIRGATSAASLVSLYVGTLAVLPERPDYDI